MGRSVGERTVRADASEKLLGTGEFVDDMQVPGHAAWGGSAGEDILARW